jgi:hypothetical protein
MRVHGWRIGDREKGDERLRSPSIVRRASSESYLNVRFVMARSACGGRVPGVQHSARNQRSSAPRNRNGPHAGIGSVGGRSDRFVDPAGFRNEKELPSIASTRKRSREMLSPFTPMPSWQRDDLKNRELTGGEQLLPKEAASKQREANQNVAAGFHRLAAHFIDPLLSVQTIPSRPPIPLRPSGRTGNPPCPRRGVGAFPEIRVFSKAADRWVRLAAGDSRAIR